MLLCSRARSRPIRFTDDQVLRGVQAFFHEHCGDMVIVHPEASVLDYEQAAKDSHECPLEFLADLASYFQLEWNEARWYVWLKLKAGANLPKRQRQEFWEKWKRDVAPTITVRRLAEYIARHAPAISFEPVAVLGRNCSTAGVFEGLCGCPEVNSMRVAPSTPLRELGGSSKICDFWARAEWSSGVALPPVRRLRLWSPRSVYEHVRMVILAIIAFAVFFSTIILMAALLDPDMSAVESNSFFGGAVGFAAGALVLLGFNVLLERMHNPLPAEVGTFGDLARLIDRRRRGAA